MHGQQNIKIINSKFNQNSLGHPTDENVAE
jgi:hypothetical protein